MKVIIHGALFISLDAEVEVNGNDIDIQRLRVSPTHNSTFAMSQLADEVMIGKIKTIVWAEALGSVAEEADRKAAEDRIVAVRLPFPPGEPIQ